jgi:hypothetical protein
MRQLLFSALALLTATVHAADGRRRGSWRRCRRLRNQLCAAEMRANLLALNEILGLVSTGKFKEAAARSPSRSLASRRWASTAASPSKPVRDRTCRRRCTPSAWTGTAASDFARIAASGDREKTIAALPSLTSGCVACHYVYRLR